MSDTFKRNFTYNTINPINAERGREPKPMFVLLFWDCESLLSCCFGIKQLNALRRAFSSLSVSRVSFYITITPITTITQNRKKYKNSKTFTSFRLQFSRAYSTFNISSLNIIWTRSKSIQSFFYFYFLFFLFFIQKKYLCWLFFSYNISSVFLSVNNFKTIKQWENEIEKRSVIDWKLLAIKLITFIFFFFGGNLKWINKYIKKLPVESSNCFCPFCPHTYAQSKIKSHQDGFVLQRNND